MIAQDTMTLIITEVVNAQVPCPRCGRMSEWYCPDCLGRSSLPTPVVDVPAYYYQYKASPKSVWHILSLVADYGVIWAYCHTDEHPMNGALKAITRTRETPAKVCKRCLKAVEEQNAKYADALRVTHYERAWWND